MPFYHNKSPVDTNNSLLTIIHVILTRDMFSHLLAVMKNNYEKISTYLTHNTKILSTHVNLLAIQTSPLVTMQHVKAGKRHVLTDWKRCRVSGQLRTLPRFFENQTRPSNICFFDKPSFNSFVM